jgi:predicted GNAT family acetyltransferase
MEFVLDQVQITHNEAAHRFEAEVQGLTAILVYKLVPAGMIIQHTEVPLELEGRGLAAKLTRTALEFARTKNFSVIPACSYAVTFMAKHPEYNDLLPPPR